MDAADDQTLVTLILSGDGAAAEHFFTRTKDTIWRSCLALTSDRALAGKLFSEACEALSENGFHRLKSYDSAALLVDFVALAVRDIVVANLVHGLSQGVSPGGVFVGIFHGQIEKKIERRARRDPDRVEIYGYVLAGLERDNYRRLRAYSGSGRFSGFLDKVIENLIEDFRRLRDGRSRYPAAIARLQRLDQLIFEEIYWNGSPPDAERLLIKIGGQTGTSVTTSAVLEGIERVRRAVPANYSLTKHIEVGLPILEAEGEELIDTALTPEEDVSTRQMDRLTESASEVVVRALGELLSDDEHDLLWRILDGPKIKGRPPTARLERIFNKLKPLASDPAVKQWLLAVREK